MSAELHLAGVCGTFMGGLAVLAAERGIAVEGSDRAFYPPMSGQLEAAGVALRRGYDGRAFAPGVRTYVIGNALSRGNPLVEAVLGARANYMSGPEWLRENVLKGRKVVAIAGTHGKTTVTSMVAAILEHAGQKPGFLVGGISPGFGVSARLGDPTAPFVVEADEYDTAFFDKRPKFMHYRPDVAVLNNLEFDHADIYADIAALRTQFSYLLRTVPCDGVAVVNADDAELPAIVGRGCHSRIAPFGAAGAVRLERRGDAWHVSAHGRESAAALPRAVRGAIYRQNALAAVAAALECGVALDDAVAGLADFVLPKRRLESAGEAAGSPVYDDFAHHPTAIASTLEVVRELHPGRRAVALFDPQSNTMKAGHWNTRLCGAFGDAAVVVHQHDGLAWDAAQVFAPLGGRARVARGYGQMAQLCRDLAGEGDPVVVLSNGDSSRILRPLLDGAAAGPEGGAQ